MKPEELLQNLRDAGMDDASIVALLDAAKGMLNVPADGANDVNPESDVDKQARIFGAI